MQGLGTLLSICQPATSSEYKQAYQAPTEAADKVFIPKLFTDKAPSGFLLGLGPRLYSCSR